MGEVFSTDSKSLSSPGFLAPERSKSRRKKRHSVSKRASSSSNTLPERRRYRNSSKGVESLSMTAYLSMRSPNSRRGDNSAPTREFWEALEASETDSQRRRWHDVVKRSPSGRISDEDPDRLEKLIVRKGVPLEYRQLLWCGNSMDGNEDLENMSLPKERVLESCWKQIDMDTPRTPYLTAATRDRLQRVLRYFSAFASPQSGYCQGMNFVAAVPLSIGLSEKCTLGILKKLIVDPAGILYGMYDPDLTGLHQEVDNLEMAVSLCYPHLLQRLGSSADFASFAVDSWLTLFASRLPYHAILRYWDYILAFHTDRSLVRSIIIAQMLYLLPESEHSAWDDHEHVALGQYRDRLASLVKSDVDAILELSMKVRAELAKVKARKPRGNGRYNRSEETKYEAVMIILENELSDDDHLKAALHYFLEGNSGGKDLLGILQRVDSADHEDATDTVGEIMGDDSSINSDLPHSSSSGTASRMPHSPAVDLAQAYIEVVQWRSQQRIDQILHSEKKSIEVLQDLVDYVIECSDSFRASGVLVDLFLEHDTDFMAFIADPKDLQELLQCVSRISSSEEPTNGKGPDQHFDPVAVSQTILSQSGGLSLHGLLDWYAAAAFSLRRWLALELLAGTKIDLTRLCL
ncbi:Growth hormone-regulated TBC protein 1 [Perkinsus chesapeaki]|uniref:Growth hormone-regulated TBC protein 1 n=1 Tax=Perkinsus chesapeaki TaxID=330153 RepID=A0A7J6MFT2_PERCH|nr:Growth hormone-regulated TBC protein 1 [Perkinsus chesapeaki]